MFTFSPLSHDAAVSRIAGLPVVSRAVMDGMLPELRAYAFTVTGLDSLDQIAKARDMIKAVPAGGKTWEKARKEIAAELADDLGGKASVRRAELLLRTHVFRSYAATRYRNLMQQVDVFPFWQYKTHGDGNVRPSHAALNGMIFPAGHPIWQRIFPPWDWGCRCLVIPLTRRAAEAIMARGKLTDRQGADANLLKSQIVTPEMFTDAEATLIDKNQRLPNGMPLNRTPTWADAPWSIPGTVHHDWKLIEARYADSPEALAAFRIWARKTEIEKGFTVDDWITHGAVAVPGAKTLPKLTLKKKLPKAADAAASSTIHDALKIAGIDTTKPITEAQAKALIEELKEDVPHDVSTKIIGFKGMPKKKKARTVKITTPDGVVTRVIPAVEPVLTEKLVQKTLAEFASYLPPNVARDLPSFTVQCVRSKRFAGTYLPSWYPQAKNGPVLELAAGQMRSEEAVRNTLFHELTHWLHLERPNDHAWVKEIKAHFEARTVGEAVVDLGTGLGTGKRDKWFNAYMGRIYDFKNSAVAVNGEAHLGFEFPTRCLELLAPGVPSLKQPNPLSIPAKLAEVWNSSPEARDDLILAMKGLYP